MDNETRRQFSELLSGPDVCEAIDETNKIHLINFTALFLWLVDKGVLNPEEFNKYKMMATHSIDQLWTDHLVKQKEKAKKVIDKIDEEIPGTKDIFGFLGILKDEDE